MRLRRQTTLRCANAARVESVSTSDVKEYAIVDVGGMQQILVEGRFYTCNSLGVESGTKIKFERVLAVKREGELNVGKPYVEGATVDATVLEEFRGPKTIVYKMAPKKHTRKKTGHRQELTKFLVNSIDM